MNLPVSIKLSSIYCHDEADGPGDAEPYLWTIFFKIDGQNIRQNGFVLAGEATFAFGAGSHNNLNTSSVVDGEVVVIPPSVGEWTTSLQPIIIKDLKDNEYRIPGIVGIVAVLMEEDNVSDSGAEAGHQALNNYIKNSINTFIGDLSLLEFANTNNPKEVLDAKIEELKKQMIDGSGSIVSDAIVNKQPWYSDLWAWVNADDKIGSEIWLFDQDEIVSRRYHIHLNKRWFNEGEWEIHGDLNAPNPCQAQLVAVNQQKVRIQNIENQIRALRAEMIRMPPAARAALQAEINEIVNTQLEPAQEQLKVLQRKLEQCYMRDSVRPNLGTIDVGVIFRP